MSNSNEKEVMATVDVSVTPTGRIRGNEVECDLEGRDVEDDAIFLERDRTFVINFNLDPHGPDSWDEENPFSARTGKCPRPDAEPHGLMRVTDVSPKQLTVTAGPVRRRSVIHYRLNFADDTTCDPIIIIG
jgi:hypothetical protein